MNDSAPAGPLAGLNVLDFSMNLPGPYATAVLAAQGATVVKVEPPRGDPARHLPGLFEQLNRGKRSIVLDLREETAREALPALFAWADVVVEGFRPGVMERLGAGPADAHAVRPNLVYCRISAFGQEGPRQQEPGHDLNLQALTGLCHLERTTDGPVAARLPLADLSASMGAVAAIGIALAGPRDRVVLDMSMAETLLSWTAVWSELDPSAQAEPMLKQVPAALRGLARRALRPIRVRLEREKLYGMPQYGLYRTRDGWIALGVVDERHFWRELADLTGLHRFRELPMGTLTLLDPLLRARLKRVIRKQPTAHWLSVCSERGLPVTPVLSAAQARSEPQFAPRMAHGGVVYPLPGSSWRKEPAPALGELDPGAITDA